MVGRRPSGGWDYVELLLDELTELSDELDEFVAEPIRMRMSAAA